MSGHIFLPSGEKVYSESIRTNIDIGILMQDLLDDENSNKYKISVINAVASLGCKAYVAIGVLRKIIQKNSGLLSKAAEEAISKISSPKIEQGKVAKSIHDGSRSDTSDYWVKNNGNNTHTHVAKKKIEYSEVKISCLETSLGSEELNRYCQCSYCDKITFLKSNFQYKWSNSLMKPFYCNFCFRNRFYDGEVSKNILALTFKGIIGYYFYSYFVAPKSSAAMYTNELKDMVGAHVIMGMRNPVFNYDYETLSWYIDFSRVSNRTSKQQSFMPVTYILETIVEIVSVFSLYENAKGCSVRKFLKKIYEEVIQFSKKRERTEKVFTPMLTDCGLTTKYENVGKIRESSIKSFSYNDLIEASYQNRNSKRWTL